MVQPQGLKCVKEHVQMIQRQTSETDPKIEPTQGTVPEVTLDTQYVLESSPQDNPNMNLDALDGIVSLSDLEASSSGYEADIFHAPAIEDSNNEEQSDMLLLHPRAKRMHPPKQK